MALLELARSQGMPGLPPDLASNVDHYLTHAEVDPPELPDDDINPDEAEPLPPDEPVKTDVVPDEEPE